MGFPQQTFWTGAVFPHLVQRNSAIGYRPCPLALAFYSRRSMMVAIPWPKPMHMV